MAKRNLKGLRILVTGASSGIGYSMSFELFKSGARVLATARRRDRLERLGLACDSESVNRGRLGELSWLEGDLTDSAHRGRLIEWCDEVWGGLDVLVNNAGAGAIGPFAQATEDRLRRVMEIDFFAPVELTRSCIPLLVASGNRPAILNMGSVLAHRAVPNKSEYCAAKFALRGWSESLRVELCGSGVDVLMVSPSTTRSEFFDSLLETQEGVVSRSLGSMSPEAVARLAIRALERSNRDSILSVGGKALVLLGKFFPGWTDRLLRNPADPLSPSTPSSR